MRFASASSLNADSEESEPAGKSSKGGQENPITPLHYLLAIPIIGGVVALFAGLGAATFANPVAVAIIGGVTAFLVSLRTTPKRFLAEMQGEMGFISLMAFLFGAYTSLAHAGLYLLAMGILAATPTLAPNSNIREFMGGVAFAYILALLFNLVEIMQSVG